MSCAEEVSEEVSIISHHLLKIQSPPVFIQGLGANTLVLNPETGTDALGGL